MIGAFWCKKLSLRDKIINALNASPMTKTELCRYLGYARVVNSASHQLAKLIIDNQVIEINKKYHLKQLVHFGANFGAF